MRNQKGFGHLGILLLVVVIAAVGFVGWKVYDNHKKDNNSVSQTSSTDLRGTVTDVGAGDLFSNYKVKTSDQGTVGVRIYAPSSCDTQAVQLPVEGYNVGDTVIVRASEDEKTDIQYYKVCAKGTYIKLEQAFLTIKEWGVKIPESAGASQITYEYSGVRYFDGTKVTKLAGVSRASFNSKELSCSSLSRIVFRGTGDKTYPGPEGIGTDTFKQAYDSFVKSDTPSNTNLFLGHFHKYINGFYYLPGHPGASCETKAANLKKEEKALTALQSALYQMVVE